MELNRAKVIDEQFKKRCQKGDYPVPLSQLMPDDVGLDRETFIGLFRSQCTSRHLDLIARELKEQNLSFYTIGSSGHEGNAAIGEVSRITDMAFLHYRSGALMAQRAQKAHYDNYIHDQILSLMASKEDPTSGGRHKVFGSKLLNVPPQTSTIASHSPKAIGAALSIYQRSALNLDEFEANIPKDGVIICSFGDASFNHSTILGSINGASWIRYFQLPLPIVFLCEDNGYGISVPTPKNWIKDTMSVHPHIPYFQCDGLNLCDVYHDAEKALNDARVRKRPVFLHLKTVRLLGHAGSDIEFHYKTLEQIEAAEAQDPLLHTARTLQQQGWMTNQEIVEFYQAIRDKVIYEVEHAKPKPRLTSADEIMAPLVPPPSTKPTPDIPDDKKRKAVFGKEYSSLKKPRTMQQCINYALTDILLQYDNAVIFGEDVGKKGGVYRVTAELQQRFSRKRVFDTIIDEQTILGTAIGMAHNGILPIPEIQFLAYINHAADQLRSEALSLSFFSNGQYCNPFVCRIPALAYQKGFGGHFHNDNAFAFLREIPSIIMACPSNGREAATLFRRCIDLAHRENRVVLFLEPIALYMTKDLYEKGDNLALSSYPEPQEMAEFGQVGIEGEGTDCAIITYGNGMYLSRQAAHVLSEQYQVHTKLIDLRWLAPLPLESILEALKGINHILIVDEGRDVAGIGESLIAALYNKVSVPLAQIAGKNCYIPIGEAWQALLPSKDMIVSQVLSLCEHKERQRI